VHILLIIYVGQETFPHILIKYVGQEVSRISASCRIFAQT
jgi:hypothetical protein